MKPKNVMIEDVKIAFRNFAGKKGPYNQSGDRNFCVLLPDDLARQMEKDGWNIRWLEPREEGDIRQGYVPVAVRFDNRPPNILMITSRGKTRLDESSVQTLDWAEIERVDIVLNPYEWEFNGKTGIKAYAKSLYVTIVEDELEAKYADVIASAQGSIGGCGNCETCDGNCACKEHGC